MHPKSYLPGTPRVHYDELASEADENSYDSESLYFEGELFTGIAWYEGRGILSEDTIVNGKCHGRCVRVYPGGTLASDGEYKDDEPVGKVTSWYENGQIAEVEEYDARSRLILRQRFLLTGVMVQELIKQPYWRNRLWTDNGALIYESKGDVSRCFAENGKCVVTIDETNNEEPDYYDDMLYSSAHTMLKSGVNLVKQPLFRWLHKRLDEGGADAKALLFSLTDHSDLDVAETAFFIIEHRDFKDAIPVIAPLLFSKRKKTWDQGGYAGPLSKLAARVLTALISNTDIATRYTSHKLLARQQALLIASQQRLQYHKNKIPEIKRRWPLTKAKHKEVYVGESSIKTAAQLFDGQAGQTRREFVHVYEYVVNERTYRATLTSESRDSEHAKDIHYRAKRPEQYLFFG